MAEVLFASPGPHLFFLPEQILAKNSALAWEEKQKKVTLGLQYLLRRYLYL